MVMIRLTLVLLLAGLLGAAQSEKPVPFSDAFERIVETLLPCGTRCIVEKYDHLLAAYDHCVMSDTGIIPRVTRYLIDNNLITDNWGLAWPAAYNVLFKQTEPVCGLYREYCACFVNYFGNICGSKFKAQLQKVLLDFETFACSTPSYLGCIADPALFNGSYDGCREQNELLQRIAWGLSIHSCDDIWGYPGIFSYFREYGQCIGAAITENNPACSQVGSTVNTYIKDAVDYFDWTIGGKDYVKCFTRDALVSPLKSCLFRLYEEFLTIPLLHPSENPAHFTLEEAVVKYINGIVINGRTKVLAWPFNVFTSCVKRAIGYVCQNEVQTVDLVNKILLPLHWYFNEELRDDIDNVCPGLVERSPNGDGGGPTCAAPSATMEVPVIGLCAAFSVIMAVNYRIIRNPLIAF